MTLLPNKIRSRWLARRARRFLYADRPKILVLHVSQRTRHRQVAKATIDRSTVNGWRFVIELLNTPAGAQSQVANELRQMWITYSLSRELGVQMRRHATVESECDCGHDCGVRCILRFGVRSVEIRRLRSCQTCCVYLARYVLQVITLEALLRSAQGRHIHRPQIKSQAKSASTQVLHLAAPKSA